MRESIFSTPIKSAKTSLGRKGLIILLFSTMTATSLTPNFLIQGAEAGGVGLRVLGTWWGRRSLC